MNTKKASYLIPTEDGTGYEKVYFETSTGQVEEEGNKVFVNRSDKSFLDKKNDILLKKDITSNTNDGSTNRVASARAVKEVKDQLGNVEFKIGGVKPSPQIGKTIIWIDTRE